MNNADVEKQKMINAMKKVCDSYWINLGVKFGKVTTERKLGIKSALSIGPDDEFMVTSSTLRTRGYTMSCELNVVLFKKDGSPRTSSSIYASVYLGTILGES